MSGSPTTESGSSEDREAPNHDTGRAPREGATSAPAPGASEAAQELGKPARVTLFTDRALFAQSWSQALSTAGLAPTAAAPKELPSRVEKGAPAVIDAGSLAYDEDELLAHVGLARAVGATPIVSVPVDVDVSSIDDILDDLCHGLVTRRPEDVTRVVAQLARRADASRARRFEYLTVSPRASSTDGEALLAVFSDGTAVLVDREVIDDDDGSPVDTITLADEATKAVLTLESGKEIELTTALVARKALLKKGQGAANGNVDGVRLGQRLRELRLAASLTQAELARRTGIHRPNIARVEAGRHTPSLETISRLASAIGVPTTAVLAED